MFTLDRYKVVFQYEPEKVVPFELSNETVMRSGVYAHILEVERVLPDGKTAWQHLFSGFAAAHPDQRKRSCKNTGRKVALSRALMASGFDKMTRTKFWEQYLKTAAHTN